LGGIEDPRGGLDMLWLVGILMAGFGVGALIFFGLGGKSRRVHQLDNYAGGHFLTADVRYQYSDNFYAGLMHLIGPWYRGAFLWLEKALTATVAFVSDVMNGFYRYAQPTLVVLVTAVALLALVLGESASRQPPAAGVRPPALGAGSPAPYGREAETDRFNSDPATFGDTPPMSSVRVQEAEDWWLVAGGWRLEAGSRSLSPNRQAPEGDA
jgi:hypothetical protein